MLKLADILAATPEDDDGAPLPSYSHVPPRTALAEAEALGLVGPVAMAIPIVLPGTDRKAWHRIWGFDVPGVRGLRITRSTRPTGVDGWDVTHVPSGQVLPFANDAFQTLAQAVGAVRAVAKMFVWTRDAARLAADIQKKAAKTGFEHHPGMWLAHQVYQRTPPELRPEIRTTPARRTRKRRTS